ncbi:MAG TPA: Spy/CpxP family protein refolding chaperone [Longimicrobiaceae bacterium]|jgi:hypothetical protein
MFRTNRVLLAAALLAAAPAPALLAQQGAGAPHAQHQDGRQGRGGPRPSPVAALLEHRAELKLTADQVSRLETIQRDLEQKNAPLRRQLEAARPQRPEGERQAPPTEQERQAMRARMEQLRPQMEQLRTNQRAAMEQVRSVLTDEQEQAARQYLRGPRGERGERGPRGERGGRGEGRQGGERGQQAPRSR